MTSGPAAETRAELERALSLLPDENGGTIVVLATSGPPPAMALLTTADVALVGDRVRVGLYGSASAARSLGGAFSLLIPSDGSFLRVEVNEATADRSGGLSILEGRLTTIRPSIEPPWVAQMSFHPETPGSPDVRRFLDYWTSLRRWLETADGQPPDVPT